MDVQMEISKLAKELYTLVVKHDYYYYMSDDHRVYTRGSDESTKIQSLIKQILKIDPSLKVKLIDTCLRVAPKEGKATVPKWFKNV